MPTLDLSSLPLEVDLEDRSAEPSSLHRDTPRSEPTTGSRRDQLQKLSSNPIFHDLQTTLRSECDAQDGVPSALLASTGHVTTLPVSVRVSQISLRFLQLSYHIVKRNQAFELQSFYVQTSVQLESARYAALGNVRGNPWLMNSVNAQYDMQHHGLLDRVEQSLKLVEDNIANNGNFTNAGTTATDPVTEVTNPDTIMARVPVNTVVTPSSRHPGTSRKITARAHEVMTSWYDQHAEHPYPTRADLRIMAESCEISSEQVRKWFYNRRQRLGDVKTMGQIVNHRKRSRPDDQDDILLEGTKFSRHEFWTHSIWNYVLWCYIYIFILHYLFNKYCK